MSTNLDEPITVKIYSDLQEAYNYFNRELFDGRLPQCLLVLSYHRNAYGYFRNRPFISRDQFAEYEEWELRMAEGTEESEALAAVRPGIDEISLNIFTFKDRTVREIMSTLVHEQVHLLQHHFGKPPKRPTHNREWAEMMKAVGLFPSDTGAEGGKQTGRRVSHYIVDDGPFDLAMKKFDMDLEWIGLLPQRKKKDRKKKITYCCPQCEAKVRGNEGLHVVCGECEVDMGTPG